MQQFRRTGYRLIFPRLICITIVFISLLLTGNSSVLSESPGSPEPVGSGTDGEHYILVVYKNKAVEKFSTDSFEFPWISAKLNDRFTCRPHEFKKDELAIIAFKGKADNPCARRYDDWLFEIHFRKRYEILSGFIELDTMEITGKLLQTGKLKSVPFEQILRISFY